MSYARSPSEGDVYVIGTVRKRGGRMHWECISCALLPAILVHPPQWVEGGGIAYSVEQYWQLQIFTAQSPGQMLTHLRLHVAAGETVPDRALTRLAEEHVEWEAARQAELDEITEQAKRDWAAKNQK